MKSCAQGSIATIQTKTLKALVYERIHSFTNIRAKSRCPDRLWTWPFKSNGQRAPGCAGRRIFSEYFSPKYSKPFACLNNFCVICRHSHVTSCLSWRTAMSVYFCSSTRTSQPSELTWTHLSGTLTHSLTYSLILFPMSTTNTKPCIRNGLISFPTHWRSPDMIHHRYMESKAAPSCVLPSSLRKRTLVSRSILGADTIESTPNTYRQYGPSFRSMLWLIFNCYKWV